VLIQSDLDRMVARLLEACQAVSIRLGYDGPVLNNDVNASSQPGETSRSTARPGAATRPG